MPCATCVPGVEFGEEAALTFHAVMLCADGEGFVWVTDRLVAIPNGYATVEKISYLKEYGVVCSVWGDQVAMHARDKLFDQLASGSVPLSDGNEMRVFLRELGEKTLKQHRAELTIPRGVVLAALRRQEKPHLYSLGIGWPPVALDIVDQAMLGDESNQALFFPHRYYQLSRKSIPELLAIGIHTVRLAAEMNTKGIRGVDAWVYERHELHQLTAEEIAPYIAKSESLDIATLESFRGAEVSEKGS
jgi:hypothetical protein